MDSNPLKERGRKALQASDSIMEPTIFSTVSEFLKAGGTPIEVINGLSESYIGYADHINTLTKWCDKLKIPFLQRLELKLMELVKSLFNPELADSIFTAQGKPPQWIESLIMVKQWRSLIYELSERHRNCLFLNFAIQRISDAGFQHEISSVSSVSSHLNVFAKVIGDLIESIIESQGKDSDSSGVCLDQLLQNFQKSACQTEHAFAFVLCLLLLLEEKKSNDNISISENGGDFARYLREMCSSSLTESHEREIAYRLYLTLSSGLDPIQDSDIFNSLLNVFVNQSTTSGDVIVLYQAYSNRQKTPALSLIQNHLFFEILLDEVFGNAKVIATQHREKYLFLLTKASSNSLVFDETFESLKWISHQLKESVLVDLSAILRPLMDRLKYPIVSAAVLAWLKSDISLFQKNLSSGTISAPFFLLEEIARVHGSQAPFVFDFLVVIFERADSDFDSILVSIEFKKSVIDRLLFLVKCEYEEIVGSAVIGYFFRVKESIDESLLVYFLNELYKIIDFSVKDDSNPGNHCNTNPCKNEIYAIISFLSETSKANLKFTI